MEKKKDFLLIFIIFYIIFYEKASVFSSSVYAAKAGLAVSTSWVLFCRPSFNNPAAYSFLFYYSLKPLTISLFPAPRRPSPWRAFLAYSPFFLPVYPHCWICSSSSCFCLLTLISKSIIPHPGFSAFLSRLGSISVMHSLTLACFADPLKQGHSGPRSGAAGWNLSKDTSCNSWNFMVSNFPSGSQLLHRPCKHP